jgi:hypothetical protein
VTDNLVPPEFRKALVKQYFRLSVSDELIADSQIPDLDLFLSDPVAYCLKHPYVPPTRRQRLKTWIGTRREKLGEKLYEFVAGTDFPDDQW